MKFLDKIGKGYVWIIISLSLTIYFVYNILSFDGTIDQAINDTHTWVHTILVVLLNVIMVSGAYDSAVNSGLNNEIFNEAEELNNKIIKEVNNNIKDFRDYISKLNAHEKKTIIEDYLFSQGVENEDELNDKQKKQLKKLKPIQHNIYGFNLPLFYELDKNGKMTYNASFKKNQGKRWHQVKKAFIGLLFSGLTINMSLEFNNFASAFSKLLIISSGLILTFVMIYVPQYTKFIRDLPSKVIRKKTLYQSYLDFKNGKQALKELVEPEIKVEEPKVIENLIVEEEKKDN